MVLPFFGRRAARGAVAVLLASFPWLLTGCPPAEEACRPDQFELDGECRVYCADGTTASDFDECPCPIGTLDCDGVCVATGFSPLHCGACGHACGASEVCENGACISIYACDPGFTKCDNVCADLSYDPGNCGTCGNTCAFGAPCNGGICTDAAPICDETQRSCGGQCVGLANNPAHCGGCATMCPTGMICDNDVCFGECACGVCGIEPLDVPLPATITVTTKDVPGALSQGCSVGGDFMSARFFVVPRTGVYQMTSPDAPPDVSMEIWQASCVAVGCGNATATAQVGLQKGQAAFVVARTQEEATLTLVLEQVSLPSCVDCVSHLSDITLPLCPDASDAYDELRDCACDGPCGTLCAGSCEAHVPFSGPCEACVLDEANGCGTAAAQCGLGPT